jgi:hypothetical protein
MRLEFKLEAMRLLKAWHAAPVAAKILGVTVQPWVEVEVTGVCVEKVKSP